MEKIYRKNVGVVVFNHENKVLMCERKDVDNAWQFPQGGIDEGEDFLKAASRELFEETSIKSVEIIATIAQPLRYEYPEQIKSKLINKKYYDGQEMNWVLFRLTGPESEINLQTNEPEFKQYGWFNLDEAPEKIVNFKKDVYIKMVEQFKPFLKS